MGNLAYQVYYKDGVQQYYSYFGKNGQLLDSIPLKSGNGTVKAYYQNGTLSTNFIYVDGKINSVDNMFYSNGKPWYESTDEYGISEGPIKTYHLNGVVKSIINYVHNEAQGPFKVYTENGKILIEGNYVNGNYNGNVLYYDVATGKLKETHLYYYGKLQNVKK